MKATEIVYCSCGEHAMRGAAVVWTEDGFHSVDKCGFDWFREQIDGGVAEPAYSGVDLDENPYQESDGDPSAIY